MPVASLHARLMFTACDCCVAFLIWYRLTTFNYRSHILMNAVHVAEELDIVTGSELSGCQRGTALSLITPLFSPVCRAWPLSPSPPCPLPARSLPAAPGEGPAGLWGTTQPVSDPSPPPRRVRLSSAVCFPKIGFCACAGTPPAQERRSWPKPNSYAKTRLQLATNHCFMSCHR